MKTRTELTLYSHCKAYGFLPRKKRYTIADAHKAMIDSLFRVGSTLSLKEARWLCICSAVHHDTDYSSTLRDMKGGLA